jgi:hypothetical protein
MTVRQAVAEAHRAPGLGVPSGVPLRTASNLAAGQTAMLDLRAGTSLVALEGPLQIGWRDHALAWLGDAVPRMSLTVPEGERFVMPQRGVVSISATHAHAASFIVLSAQDDRRVLRDVLHDVLHGVRRVLRQLADVAHTVKARWRRAA